ncbi:MAG: sodium-independent anion transporter [Deltaproteobacteria bacterium]|nr:sodium-independent anion transporter [Deltaproteobacteria bacterium]MBU51029.1 sodium-independent anion transporter [Deltaproteobacteria bacterium]|tara:strand:- start:192 stop:1874 length:1683 start_codon:yes stop_codon:yes gene_type:complete
MGNLSKYIPVLHWLPNYNKEDLSGDLIAGFTVAVMLIPQGMAYAMLAGLPPEIGLYSSILPLMVYALFGTSRQLAVGPVAMVSLLVASGIRDLGQFDVPTYIAYAVMLSMMIGLIQFAMGAFRLGFLVNFLSHPVISGFTSAAAIIIGLSQLKHLLGVNLKRSHHLHEIIIQASSRIGETKLLTFAIGLGGILLILALKRWAPKVPSALVAVAISTLLVYFFRLDKMGVAIVKDVPGGSIPLQVPSLDMGVMQKLIPTALAISLVGFMESIAVAKNFATKNRYKVDANQELIGLGLANIMGAFAKAYPVTGGFSRTAVNAQAGARTGLASLITAVLIGITLFFLTGLFYFLPKAILASIIFVAVFGLIDFQEVKHLWQVKKVDAIVLLVTFVITLFVGIKQGIGVGVVLSLVMIIYRSTQPHTTELGCLEDTHVYRNPKHFPEVEMHPNTLIMRMDASLYFANTSFFKDRVDELLADAEERDIKHFILDASSINDVDSAGVTALEEVRRELEDMGIDMYIASAKGPVREVFKNAHFEEHLPAENFTLTIDEAVSVALGKA